MPAQGWAGSQAPGQGLKCAACLLADKAVLAETQISGTILCQAHAKEWAEKANATLASLLQDALK